MPLVFKRTDDEDYPRHLKILVQGPPKAGKTTFLSTAPNILVAALPDAGLASIAHKGIPFVDVQDTDTLQQLEMVLRDDQLRAKAAAKVGLPSIDTIAIDTLDGWQDILKKEILAENRRTQMQQPDWGTLKERMAAIMKRFITLPMNVIFTVHTTTTQDEESRLIYMPALQGGIKDEVAGFVDYSLAAFRSRETGTDGVSRVNYYLKNEGDQKNPTIGNRGAGRIPEVSAPDFQLLHKLHFGAIQARPRDIVKGDESEDVPEVPAQRSSKPVAAKTPEPTGVPSVPPSSEKINASGLTMLTGAYTEHALTVPEDIREWELTRAYKVARWFTAWKADKAAGKHVVTRDDLIEGLKAYDAFAGELKGVQTGVENLKNSRAKPEPEPEPKSTTEDEVAAEDAAIALVQDQLGGVVIGYEIAPDAVCEVCSKPVDDADIARLGRNKFKKLLCVNDYKALVKETRN